MSSRAGPSKARPRPQPLPRIETVKELRDKHQAVFEALRTYKTGIDRQAMEAIVSHLSEWPIGAEHRAACLKYFDFCSTNDYSCFPIQPLRVAPFIDYQAQRPPQGKSTGVIGPNQLLTFRYALEALRKDFSAEQICFGNDLSVHIELHHQRAHESFKRAEEEGGTYHDTKPRIKDELPRFEEEMPPPMPTTYAPAPAYSQPVPQPDQPYIKPEPTDQVVPPEAPRTAPRPRLGLDAMLAAAEQSDSNVYSSVPANTQVFVEIPRDLDPPFCVPKLGYLIV